MKLHIEKSLLQDAINTTIRAVPTKSTIPALEGLLLDAHGDTLTVTAYNTQMGIRTQYEAKIEREGRIVLNAKLFSEIIRKMPDDTVTLDCADDLSTKVKCGKASYSIMAIPADDYPELPEIGESNGFCLDEATMKSIIAETSFAVSTNEARPIQTGELFEVSGGELNVVACDGFRLAVRTEKVESKDMEFVVPGNALNEVERLCAESKNEVNISVGDRHILFSIGSTELISRRLDGEFLKWRDVIPQNNNLVVKVDAKSMMQSIDRVSVVLNDKMKSPMRCKVGSGEITLATKTAIGAANDKCKVEGDGKDLEIGFNNRYLGEAFRYAPEQALTMSFQNSATAAVIKGSSDKFLYMVLPVRLKKE